MMRTPGRGSLDRATTPRAAVLSLGSNLGDRGQLLRAAVAALRSTPGIDVTAVSPVVESVAVKVWGADRSAPRYLNAIVLAQTMLTPHGLLAVVQRIEIEHGRKRLERWGDRTLDIDIIDFDGLESGDPTLTLPHPRAGDRAFVLAPWLAVDPDAFLPGIGRVDARLARIGNDTVPAQEVRL